MDSMLSDEVGFYENEAEGKPREITFQDLKKDTPGAKLKNVKHAIQKIVFLNELSLPKELLADLPVKLIKKYYLRVMAERPSYLREYKPETRYALFSLFGYLRSAILTDDLVGFLVKLNRQIKSKAETFIDKKILSEVRCVNGKFDILLKLSRSALNNPEGVIQDIIYPEVGQEVLSDLVNELYSKAKRYQTQVHKKMHSLYSYTHKNKLIALINSLDLKTNLDGSKKILDAVEIILSYQGPPTEYYPVEMEIPVEGVLGIFPPKRTKTAAALDPCGLHGGYTFFKQEGTHRLTSSFPLNLANHRSTQSYRCLLS